MPDWWTASFMPHGHCWLWSPPMLALQVGTNLAIALAYFAISVTLGVLVARVEDIPFRWIYVAFGVFIVTCGVTHLLDVWVIWRPDYWVDAGVRFVTAFASVGTAVMLPPLIPQAQAVARGAKAMHDRGLRLEHLAEDLARSYREVKELEDLRSTFFANVSHDLRTPLALILGPVERLLASGEVRGAVAHDLEVVQRNARTLLRQVEDLLDLARIEAGQAQVAYARVDVAALVREALATYEVALRDRGVTVRAQLPEALVAEVDGRKLERVVLNLLSNALAHARDEGVLRVTLANPGERLVLEVADDGPGIPPEERDAAFDRFRRLSGPRAEGGSGLGLAISRDFVVLHGGTVAIGDAPEGGALLRVELPARAPEGAPVEAAWTAVPQPARTAAEPEHPSRERDDRPLALVVEDNADMAAFLADSLADRYATEVATDGADALGRLQVADIDLVVTDLMMPGVGGEQLVRALRAAGADVPVLMVSARADADVRIAMLEAGVDDFLVKPFRIAELRARAARLIGTHRATALLRRELAGRQGDLEQLVQALADQRREVERASAMKTNFLRMITHELRAPVHALTLQVEVMARAPERASALIARQRRALLRLGDMIEMLLLHARIEAGLGAVFEEVDVVRLARGLVDDLRADLGDRPLAVSLSAPAALPLESDPRMLRLILGNLLGNAVKFTERGEVTVEIVEDPGGETVTLTVRDTGPGIRDEDRARIFEPFEQVADPAHKHAAGIGLGLSLVREFTAALGGQVTLSSKVGVGSAFAVRLPRGRR